MQTIAEKTMTFHISNHLFFAATSVNDENMQILIASLNEII